MARPQKCRRICAEPAYEGFVPRGIPSCGTAWLTLDEYETIRLIDLEKLTQEQCARQMDVSRTTVTEIYASAREKLADCIVRGKILRISGGHYRLCDGSGQCDCRKNCVKATGTTQTRAAPPKGENRMRIAVTYEDGMIFQHFGHTAQFKLYDVADGKIVDARVVDTNGSGHGALAGFLAGNGVDALICGGIGGGAQAALAEAGIRLYGGVSGDADCAVEALITGTLGYNPDVRCSHHDHGHEGHTCGSNGCGSHSCH